MPEFKLEVELKRWRTIRVVADTEEQARAQVTTDMEKEGFEVWIDAVEKTS